MALFNAEDYNGECFVLGSQGEREELLPAHVIPYLAADNMGPGLVKNAAQCDAFFINQLDALAALPADPELTQLAIAKIAFLRTLAYRHGYFDTVNDHVAHRCHITDYHVIAANAAAPFNAIVLLTAPIKARLRAKFTNMLCCVAYMFRIRGHHYMDGFNAKYAALWRKCLYEEDDPGLHWKFIARYAFHAIYPDTLDDIWRNAVLNARCAGALMKRFDCAPAGIASIVALRKGLDDLAMNFPSILVKCRRAIEHLEELEVIVTNHRWAGSINRRFYNGPPVVVDESILASLAATILGAIGVFCPDAPLNDSRALQRLASNARITQGVMGIVIQKAAQEREMVRAMLPEREEKKED
jgi:hypothetical protein